MNPRLVLAVILSMTIFLSWSAIEKKFFPKAYQYRQEQLQPTSPSQPALSTTTSVADGSSNPLRLSQNEATTPQAPMSVWTLQNDFVELAISSVGGGVVSANTIEHHGEKVHRETVLASHENSSYLSFLQPEPWAWQSYEVVSQNQELLVIQAQLESGLKIVKSYHLNHGYAVDINLSLSNTGATPLALQDGYTMSVADSIGAVSSNRRVNDFKKLLILEKNRQKPESFKSIKERKIIYETPTWMALQDKYFTLAFKPLSELNTVYLNEGKNPPGLSFRSRSIILQPGQKVEDRFVVYIGPKDKQSLNNESAIAILCGPLKRRTANALVARGVAGAIIVSSIMHNPYG